MKTRDEFEEWAKRVPESKPQKSGFFYQDTAKDWMQPEEYKLYQEWLEAILKHEQNKTYKIESAR